MCMHCCNYLNNNNEKIKDVMAALLSTQSKKNKTEQKRKRKNGMGLVVYVFPSPPIQRK